MQRIALVIAFLAAILAPLIIPQVSAKEMAGGKPAPIAIPAIVHKGPVDFEKELLPVLSGSCLACHNKTKARAGLILETPADIRKGSDDGLVVTPGKGAQSLLVRAASHAADVEQTMPPHENKVAAPDLTPAQLALLQLWIDQGATGEVHGSLAPLVWQALPADFDPIYAVAVTRDGKSAACGRANHIDVYDLPAGRWAGRLVDPNIAGSSATVGSPSGSAAPLAPNSHAGTAPQPIQANSPSVAAAPRPVAANSRGETTTAQQLFPTSLLGAAAPTPAAPNSPPMATSLIAHRDMVESLAFSPDGEVLASGSYREIKLWRRSTTTATIALGDQPAACITASPDGTLLATGAADGRIRLFNAGTLNPLGELTGHEAAITNLRFSPDGTKLLSSSRDKTVRVWDVAKLKTIATLDSPTDVLAICWAAAGRQVATGGPDGLIRLWKLPDSPGGEMTAVKELKGHEGPVNALDTLLGDPTHLVSGGQDGTIRRWNTESGTASKKMSHGSPVIAVIARKDNKRFVSLATDGVAKLWNIEDLQKLADLKGPALPANSGPPATAPAASLPLRAIAFSPDGSLIATVGDDGFLRTFTSERGTFTSSTGDGKTPGLSVAFAGPARALACGAKFPPAISASSSQWKLDRTIANPDSTSPLADRVTSLDFSPDGLLLAAASGVPTRSGEIRLFDVATGTLKRAFDDVHSDSILCVRFSPDGSQLATSSADRFVRILDANTGKVVRSLERHGSHALGVAWRRNGHTLASVGADNELHFWDAATGDRGKVVLGFDKEVTSVTYLGDSDNVVATSGDGKVRLISEAGADVRGFSGATGFLFSVAATADGATILAGGEDGILRAWDAKTGQPTGTFLPPDRRDISSGK